MCAAVTQTLFTMPTSKPCRKNFPGARAAIAHAQTMKMASQHHGSIFESITKTVPTAMARPKRERRKMSFQFIAPSSEQCKGAFRRPLREPLRPQGAHVDRRRRAGDHLRDD